MGLGDCPIMVILASLSTRVLLCPMSAAAAAAVAYLFRARVVSCSANTVAVSA